MLTALIEGFLLGIGAAIPIGPINILIMNWALKSYPHAVATGVGAMSADGLYLILILFGMAPVLQQPLISGILAIFGAFFLFFLAYRIFEGRDNNVGNEETQKMERRLLGSYLQGFVLTFVNPYTVAFWLSIAGYTAGRALDPFITLAGMFCGIILWVTLMPYFVHRSKHKISHRLTYRLSVVAALLMTGFGLSLVVAFLKSI